MFGTTESAVALAATIQQATAPRPLLTKEEAHEASQGTFMQAAWLEERANNEPDTSKRRELLRRAYIALEVAKRLKDLS
jgi:hypothetical protein